MVAVPGFTQNMHTKLRAFSITSKKIQWLQKQVKTTSFGQRFWRSVKTFKDLRIFINHQFENYHKETVKFHDFSMIWKHFPKCNDFSRPGIQSSSTITFDCWQCEPWFPHDISYCSFKFELGQTVWKMKQSMFCVCIHFTFCCCQ